MQRKAAGREVRLERAEKKTTSYSHLSHAKSVLRMFAVHALFLLSSVLMARRVLFPVRLSAVQILLITVLLLALLILFETALPLLEKKMAGRFAPRLLRAALCGVTGVCAAFLCRAYYGSRRLDVEDGLLRLVSDYVAIYNSYFKRSMSLPKGKAECAALAFCFLLLVAVLVQVLLVELTGKNVSVLLLPVAVIAAEMWVGLTPDLGSFFVFSASCVFLAVGEKGSWKAAVAAVAVWSVLFFGTDAFGASAAEKLILKAPEYKAFQEKAERAASEFKIADIGRGSAAVTNQPPVYTDKLILTVTADKRPSGNLYLKNFVGTTYKNGRWAEDADVFSGACAAGGIDEEAMSQKLWQEVSGRYGGMLGVGYTITYKNAMNSYAAVPYFCDVEQAEGIRPAGDRRLKKRVGSRTLSAQGASANDRAHFLSPLMSTYYDADSDKEWDWYDSYALNCYSGGADGLSAVRNTAKSIAEYFSITDVMGRDEENPMSESVRGRGRTNRLRAETAEDVSYYLRELYAYSWNLDDTGGRDTVEYFLETGKKGYCMHFASAGTLILRQLGIPARYASGYVVKAGSFHQQEDGTYVSEVIDRNAHAWTEIYLEKIGWVPIEMTAGYLSAYGALPTDEEEARKREESEKNGGGTASGMPVYPDEEDSEDTEIRQEDSEPDDDGEDSEEDSSAEDTESGDESQTGGGTGSGNGGTSGGEVSKRQLLELAALSLVLLTVAAASVLWVRRRLCAYREAVARELQGKRYLKAVTRINQRIYKRLRRTAHTGRRHLTDADYERLLCSTFAQIPPGDWSRYMEIVKKAAFSAEALKQEEALFCYGIYQRLWRKG